jgi:hypothetical protein
MASHSGGEAGGVWHDFRDSLGGALPFELGGSAEKNPGLQNFA